MRLTRTSLAILAAASLAWACRNNDPESPAAPDPTAVFNENESEWVRLAAFDGSNRVMVLNPVSGEATHTVDGPLTEGASYYVSNTGRYITSIERAQNRVRFFDSGIENHDDHGHEYAARWLDLVLNAPLPTHFSAAGEHIVIFNDGDGSIFHVEEDRLEFPAYQPPHIPVTEAHHGAAVRLNSGLFAVSFKEAGTAGLLPQFVKLVDGQGQVQHENPEVRVTGIHGDASNGTHGVFGATEGIIVADAQNNIRLIPNIAPLGEGSGNWMGTVRGNDNLDVFYGFARNHGIFQINPTSNSMTHVYTGNDVRTYMISPDGNYLIVQRTNNEVMVMNARTGQEVSKASIATAQIPGSRNFRTSSELEVLQTLSEPDPVLTVSSRYLYILEPSQTEVSIYDLSNLQKMKTLTLPQTAVYLTRVGF